MRRLGLPTNTSRQMKFSVKKDINKDFPINLIKNRVRLLKKFATSSKKFATSSKKFATSSGALSASEAKAREYVFKYIKASGISDESLNINQIKLLPQTDNNTYKYVYEDFNKYYHAGPATFFYYFEVNKNTFETDIELELDNDSLNLWTVKDIRNPSRKELSGHSEFDTDDDDDDDDDIYDDDDDDDY